MGHDVDHIIQSVYASLRDRALKLTGDRDRADDLVHDTLVRLLVSPRRPSSTDLIMPWLLLVMRRLFIDGTRALERRWQPLGEYEPAAPLPIDEPPVWEAIPPESIQAAVESLPPILREPYEMHTIAKKPYRTIASRLAIAVATVATRVHRARLRLRRALLGAPLRGRRNGATDFEVTAPVASPLPGAGL